LEPRFLRHFVLGDGTENGGARFRRHQIVVILADGLLVSVIANRDHFLFGIVEEAEIHRIGKPCGVRREIGDLPGEPRVYFFRASNRNSQVRQSRAGFFG